MVVSVTFSRVSSGLEINDVLKGNDAGINHGAVANGAETYPEDIYIRHDGLNEITDCKFYLGIFTGDYKGAKTAALDFDGIKAWGDAGASDGFLIDVNHDDIYEYNVRTGQMDSIANAVSLDDSSAGGINPDGIGVSGEAHIKLKIIVPASETVAGVRQLDFLMKFSFTS